MDKIFYGNPFKKNLRIIQGATFSSKFRWNLGDTKENATPVDLTGCKARMHIREYLDAPEPLVTLTTENGRITLGGATGEIEVDFTDEITAGFNWVKGVYDLEIEFADGRVRRFMEGKVTLSREVTRNV